MKKILLSVPGMSDDPIAGLDLKTPLSIASLPTLKQWVSTGEVIGTRAPNGADREELAFKFLFPNTEWSGLAPLIIEPDFSTLNKTKTSALFRFVTVFNDKVVDPSSHLTDLEADVLIKLLNQEFNAQGVYFGSFSSKAGTVSFADDFQTENEYLSQAPGPETLAADQKSESSYFLKSKTLKSVADILLRARDVLENSDINKIKVDLEENPASGLVFWGFTSDTPDKAALKPGSKHKLITDDAHLAAAVSSYGANVSLVSLTPGEPSSLQKIGECLKRDLLQYEALLVWVSAIESVSYTGDYKQKIRWLECFDQFICKSIPLENTHIVCTPVFTVSSSKKRMTAEPVPTIVIKNGVAASESGGVDTVYSEESFRRSDSAADLMNLIQ